MTTTQHPPGNWVPADEATEVSCPACGAEPGQQCSYPDPQAKGLAIEIATLVHTERAEAAQS